MWHMAHVHGAWHTWGGAGPHKVIRSKVGICVGR